MKRAIMKILRIKTPMEHREHMKEIGKAMADGFKQGMDNVDKDVASAVRATIDHTMKQSEQSNGQSGHVHNVHDNHTVIDPLLLNIERTVWAQQDKVLQSGKYDHPVHKDNHNAVEWLNHQMEEFSDALVYHECLKQTMDDVSELIYQAMMWNKTERIDRRDIVDAILHDAMNRLKGGADE